MPRFAANISTMFTDRPFAERIQAAAAAGFNAVECQFPYEVDAEELEARLDHAGLDLVLLNTPPGDFAAGERGLAALPGREAEFRAGLDRALEYASRLGCPQIHVMAGIRPDGVSRESLPGSLQGQSADRGRYLRPRRQARRDRADQHPRHPGLSAQHPRRSRRDHRGAGRGRDSGCSSTSTTSRS